MPYSETCDTFRAADCTAVRTGSGSVSFVGFDVAGSVPSGFVFEHGTERGPASIKHGFCHPRLSQFGRAHIADNDQFVFASDPRGLLVKVVATSVGDLGVDRADAALVSGPLRNGKLCLVSAVVLEGGDAGAICADGERLDAKVNADTAFASRQIVGHVALETDVPSTTGVLIKTTGFERSGDISRLPEVKVSSEIGAARAVDLHCSLNKRYPTKSPIGATTCTPSQMSTIGVAFDGILTANGLHSVGVQPEHGGASSAQPNQVESSWPSSHAPSFPSGFGFTLDLVAIVPYLIACEGVSHEMASRRCVFNAVFDCNDHGRISTFLVGSRQEHGQGSSAIPAATKPIAREVFP